MNRQILRHGHTTESSCIAMSKHNSISQTRIISGDEDGNLMTWSLNGELLDKINISDNSINSIICSKLNTNTVYTSSGTTVFILDVRNIKETLLQIELGDEEINQLALNDNETYLASADDSGNIKVYDLHANKLFKTLRKHTNIASDLTYRPNRPSELISAGFDEMLLTWDISKSRAFCSIKVSDINPVDEATRSYVVSPAFVQSISTSDDGNLLAVGTENALVQIYDSSKRVLSYTHSITRHTKCVSQVRFLPASNTHLCSAANDGYIHIWRLTDLHPSQVTYSNGYHDSMNGSRRGNGSRNNRNGGVQEAIRLGNHDDQNDIDLGNHGNEGSQGIVPVCSWNVSEKINWICAEICSGINYLLISDTSDEPYIITLPNY